MAKRNKMVKKKEKDNQTQSTKATTLMKKHTYQLVQLPDLVIIQIISHLSSKHIVKASLLSKEWQTFCSSSLILDIDEDQGNKQTNDPKKQRRQFLKFLTSCLKLYENKTHLNKLRLRMRYLGFDSKINKTLSFALERNIKELDICFKSSDVNKAKAHTFHLRQTLLGMAKSLTILKLENLYIEEDDLFNPLTFPSLKTMSLENVMFTVIRYGFSKLCLCCPRLENLSLTSCRDWDVRLANPMLKKLEILRCKINLRLEATITNLETFKFRNDHVTREHVMGLQQSFYVNSSPTLRTLEFDHTHFPNGWFGSFDERFPCMEKLVLRKCTSYRSVVKISSRIMRSFELHDDFGLVWSDLYLDAPNLTEAAIRIKGKRYYIDYFEATYDRLIKFFGNFSGCKKLRLHVDKMCVFPARVRECYSSPLASVERLEVEIDNVTTIEAEAARSAVLDLLRWMAPSLQFLSINGIYYICDGRISS